MTPDQLLAAKLRSNESVPYPSGHDQTALKDWMFRADHDRRALLAEVDRLTQVRLRLQALEQAERDATPGASRAEKVGHKAAAEAYSIAGALLDGEP